MTTCGYKHTKYQPEGEDWHCPKCGANNDNGEFYIYESVGEGDHYENCEKLHTEDWIKCERCGWEDTGAQLTKLLIKEQKLVPCPCCKGKGYVKKEDENEKNGQHQENYLAPSYSRS